ncbi:hypothetical protein [Pedobacter sp. UBA4863]|uniref:hypothetical protein n=1 Tax=Pedobacter sp. UBA4863 TaxID=1947060 RepID=UPI0025DE0E37|nr:hypothetical protein [Pedobacter sp. UBA4863]
MFSQEIIYQHLQSKEYGAIITLLHENGNKLDNDSNIHYAINIFINDLFNYVKNNEKGVIKDLNHDLDILLMCHTQKKYLLNPIHLLQLIHILYPRVAVNYLYDVAKDFPNDNICQKILKEFQKQKETSEIELKQIVYPKRATENIISISGQKFETEVKNKENISWLKVYLRSNELLNIVANHIRKLKSVDRVNITPKSNHSDLTIYARRPYNIIEVQEEVTLTLENYFSRSPADPIFKDEVISGISDIAYYQILDYIIKLGVGLEGFRNLSCKMDEERYRDYFVNYLDSLSNNHMATGETFHGAGKSDILIRNSLKEVLLVAECKLWSGQANLKAAVNQLFNRYIVWRDGKAALLIFNTKASGFTKIINTAVETLKSHHLCFSFEGKRFETSYSFLFRNHQDSEKLIKLELVLFNFV